MKSFIRKSSGPGFFFIVLLLGWSQSWDPKITVTFASGAWMLTWWLNSAVPVAVTALLPIILFPLTGTMKIAEVTATYGTKHIYLFMGGFLIAIALEKWNLHRRLALSVLSKVGHSRGGLIAGFMLVTSLLSMWISNTATTLMMLPIAMSIISEVKEEQGRFSVALLLGTAFAANIGGAATLIGTPPNVAMAGIVSDLFGIEVPFLSWMVLAMPFVILIWIIGYLLITRVLIRVGSGGTGTSMDMIHSEIQKLGPLSPSEKRVYWIFLGTALSWILRRSFSQWTGIVIDDTTIGIAGGSLFFLVPAGGREKGSLLEWDDTKRLPWGILLLFGGGMALAKALEVSGILKLVTDFLYGFAGDGNWMLLLCLVTLAGLILTQVMSNIAMAIVMVPIIGELAFGMGLNPLLFTVPIAITSSCAFMLPMSTPPNAIVFGSNQIQIHEMLRVGSVLTLIVAVLGSLLGILFLPSWIAWI